MQMNDIAGRPFGRLIAQWPVGRINRGNSKAPRIMWLASCECGTIIFVRSSDLTTGNTGSCGCAQREIVGIIGRSNLTHGHNRRPNGRRIATPEYRSWGAMLARCERPQFKQFKYYGGRGITVCEKWHDFATFLADMGHRPAGTTLDRVDNDGNYEPGNCRWATPKQQANNRRVKVSLLRTMHLEVVRSWGRKDYTSGRNTSGETGSKD